MVKDFIIIGAGFFGATAAHLLAQNGHTVLLIDKRDHIAGNAYTYNIDNIEIHKYGPHIFHTSNEAIWNFVNNFGKFNNYKHRVIANNNGKYYPIPINMMTFNLIYGFVNRRQALSLKIPNKPSDTVEQWCINNIGNKMYEMLIRDYTRKQWRCDPAILPASIIKRLPLRYDFNSDYFNDRYQGIPIDGYTNLVTNMLDHKLIDLRLSTEMPADWRKYARYLIYSGPIDQLLSFEFGELPYLTLDFEHKRFDEDFQGCSIVNYTGREVDYTRIIEHKHFTDNISSKSWVTFERPVDWHTNSERYYPVILEENIALYKKYQNAIKNNRRIFVGGRLGSYRYLDMHQVIASAMSLVSKIIGTSTAVNN